MKTSKIIRANGNGGPSTWDPTDFSAPPAKKGGPRGSTAANADTKQAGFNFADFSQMAPLEEQKPPKETLSAVADKNSAAGTKVIDEKPIMAFVDTWRPPDLSHPQVPIEAKVEKVEEPKQNMADIQLIQEILIRETLARAQQEAQEQVEQMLDTARQEAEYIVRQAQASASNVTYQARYEGLATGQAEAAQLILLAKNIVDEVRTWREAMLTQSEPMVTELVVAMAKKIFGNGLVLEQELLEHSFDKALVEAKPLGDLRIRAHPDDVATLGPLWPDQQSSLRGQRIELVPDQDVKRGGCYIEGQFGSVDARVDMQSRLITEAFSNVLASNALASNPFTTHKTQLGGSSQ